MKYILTILFLFISFFIYSQSIHILFDSLVFNGYDGEYPILYETFIDEIDFDVKNQSMTVYFYRIGDDGSKTWYINHFRDFIPFEDRFGGDILSLNSVVYINKEGRFVFDYLSDNPYGNVGLIPSYSFNKTLEDGFDVLEIFYDWSSPKYEMICY
jgi:hypothetical protein